MPTAQSRVIAGILAGTYGAENVSYQEFHGCGRAADAFYTDEKLAEADLFLQDAFGAV